MILKQTSALALIITFALPAYSERKADVTPVLRYSDDIEPEKGTDLSPSDETCTIGKEQSPINLKQDKHLIKNDLSFSYGSIPLKLTDNKHTIKVIAEGENFVIFDGEKYKLLQFHYHTTSEHTIDRKSFPVGIHFVHKNDKGNYLVVGVLATEGAENSEYTKIISNAPIKANETFTPENVLIDLNKFIPLSEKAYQYAGSFTTLPCTEGVKWFVLETPVTLSKEQIDSLSTIHPNNNRPIQR